MAVVIEETEGNLHYSKNSCGFFLTKAMSKVSGFPERSGCHVVPTREQREGRGENADIFSSMREIKGKKYKRRNF